MSRKFHGMAAAHDARIEPPQAFSSPTDCAGKAGRAESHAYQTELPSGHEQTVRCRHLDFKKFGFVDLWHVRGFYERAGVSITTQGEPH
jgi:hypothetical protein